MRQNCFGKVVEEGALAPEAMQQDGMVGREKKSPLVKTGDVVVVQGLDAPFVG